MSICKECKQELLFPVEEVEEAEHIHTYTIAYTMKYRDEHTTTYHCKSCGDFKKEEGIATQTEDNLLVKTDSMNL